MMDAIALDYVRKALVKDEGMPVSPARAAAIIGEALQLDPKRQQQFSYLLEAWADEMEALPCP